MSVLITRVVFLGGNRVSELRLRPKITNHQSVNDRPFQTTD